MNDNYTKFLEESLAHEVKMIGRLMDEMRKLRKDAEILSHDRTVMLVRIQELEAQVRINDIERVQE